MSFKPRNFREWCNNTIPVLPQVYGDELSYYELLNKVIERCNAVSITVNELIDYVNHYFDSLDVQQMINVKLDQMAQDGTLADLINNKIFSELNNEIDEINQYVHEGIKLNIAKYFTNLYVLLKNGDKAYTTANTELLQAILNEKRDSYLFYVPAGYDYYLNEVVFHSDNITFFGGGTIHGSIKSGKTEWERLDNINFFNIVFDNDETISETGTKYCLYLQFVHELSIMHCKFKNAKYAIYIPEYDENAFQHVQQIRIESCDFDNVGYAFFTENKTTQWQIGDSYFLNNNVHSTITNFYCCGCDGFVISGNTFFLPDYTKKSTYKENNIFIYTGTWLEINNNVCFESGYEGIKLVNVYRSNISNNNIGLSGQRKQSSGSGILLTTDGTYNEKNVISDNTIIQPSGDCIKLEKSVTNIVSSNYCDLPSRAQIYYYGENFINEGFNGISAEDAVNTLITDNQTNGGTISGGLFCIGNLDNAGYKSNIIAKSYTVNALSGKNYAAITTDYVAVSAFIEGDSVALNNPAVVYETGWKEVSVVSTTGTFSSDLTYHVIVLMDTTNRHFEEV